MCGTGDLRSGLAHSPMRESEIDIGGKPKTVNMGDLTKTPTIQAETLPIFLDMSGETW